MDLTISLGGHPLLTLVDPPDQVGALVTQEFGRLVEPGTAATTRLTFEPLVPRRPTTVVSTAGVRVLVDADSRAYLLDGAGRAGQLPTARSGSSLRVDPDLDARPRRTLAQLIHRLVEWQAHGRGMVLLKGSAVALEGRGIALVGFAGTGKSSILLALLSSASSYVADERLVLSAPATVASFPSPIRLAADRRVDKQTRALLGGATRAGLHLAGWGQAAPGPLSAAARAVLGDRWVSVAPTAIAPHLTWQPVAPLDHMFFLLPGDVDEIDVRPVARSTTTTMAETHAAYLVDQFLGPLRRLIDFTLPDESPWSVAAAGAGSVTATETLLDEVQGWILRFPSTASPAAVAAAVLSAAGHRGRGARHPQVGFE